MSNYRAHITGNRNIVGNHNTQINVDADSGHWRSQQEELVEQLQALRAAFDAERDVVAAPDDVSRSIDDLASQLGSDEKPNRLTLTSILTGIAAAASAATSVVTAAEQLKETVGRLL
jgi:hypothetical protein